MLQGVQHQKAPLPEHPAPLRAAVREKVYVHIKALGKLSHPVHPTPAILPPQAYQKVIVT